MEKNTHNKKSSKQPQDTVQLDDYGLLTASFDDLGTTIVLRDKVDQSVTVQLFMGLEELERAIDGYRAWLRVNCNSYRQWAESINDPVILTLRNGEQIEVTIKAIE